MNTAHTDSYPVGGFDSVKSIVERAAPVPAELERIMRDYDVGATEARSIWDGLYRWCCGNPRA